MCFGVTKSNSLRPPPPTSLSLLLWPTNPISLMHFCEEQSQILPVLHCEASRHGAGNRQREQHEHGRQRPSERAIEGAPLPTSAPLCKLTAAVLSARSSSRRRRRPRRRRRQRPKARATLKEIKPRTDGGTDALRSQRDKDHHRNADSKLINFWCAPDLSGPQKRNFRSG